MMYSFSRISVGDSEIILRPPTFCTGVLCIISSLEVRLFPDCKLPRMSANCPVVSVMLLDTILPRRRTVPFLSSPLGSV